MTTKVIVPCGPAAEVKEAVTVMSARGPLQLYSVLLAQFYIKHLGKFESNFNMVKPSNLKWQIHSVDFFLTHWTKDQK